MRHGTSAQWIGMVRGTLASEERIALERHAEQCEACAETLRFWQRFADFVGQDRAYEPPPATLDVVKRYFTGYQPPPRSNPVAWAADRLQAVVGTLVFDTLQQPLPAGIRGGTSGARHLLYEAPPLSIDLRLETSGRSPRILLAGQIVNAHSPSEDGEGAHVAVGGPAAEVTAVIANQFGEFQCEFDWRDDLTLFVGLKDGQAIVIPLDRWPISGREDRDGR